MDERKALVVKLTRGEIEDVTAKVAKVDEKETHFEVTYSGSEKIYQFSKPNLFYSTEAVNYDVDGYYVSIKNGIPRKYAYAAAFGPWVKLFLGCGTAVIAKKEWIKRDKTGGTFNSAARKLEYVAYLSRFFSIECDEGEANNYLEKQYQHLGEINQQSALFTYLTRSKPRANQAPGHVIYPFGINPSQKVAVERALTNQISIIEGPPGTGKTQTILNIIANVISEGGTVGVVAGNNSATDNVKEKLESKGFGFILAALGSKERKNAFFAEENVKPDLTGWELEKESLLQIQSNYKSISFKLDEALKIDTELAELKQKLSALETEIKHFEKRNPKAGNIFGRISLRKNSSASLILKLINFLEYGHLNGTGLRLTGFLTAFFKFGIYKFRYLRNAGAELIINLHKDYYDKRKAELHAQMELLTTKQSQINSKTMMETSRNLSMQLFKHAVAKKRRAVGPRRFNTDNYKRDFADFTKQYPLILSTTNSMRTSVKNGVLLDYLIIDEASQVDIVTGGLALSCCKNLVVVGDLKQISNFASEPANKNRERVTRKFRIEQGYDFYTNSIMSSMMAVFEGAIPRTLLREHYRCHPKIIGFCNQQFYNGELLVMTEERGRADPFLVYPLKDGNHARKLLGRPGLSSEREVAVIRDEVLKAPRLAASSPDEIGIIAPYRRHIERTRESLNGSIETDTVFKYQGREKPVIVLSTVANSVNDFIDRPDLVNVAVSRAVDQFVLVTGSKIFNDEKSNIGALVRYINYHSMGGAVIPSKKSSVFDLLYSEQSELRRQFLAEHTRKSDYESENLIDKLLLDLLSRDEFSGLKHALHVPLFDVAHDVSDLPVGHQKFARNPWTHLDFVVFSKIDKSPVLAIEVDGYQYHANNKEQQRRDAMKDEILEHIGLRIIRLATDGCDEEARITNELRLLTQNMQSVDYPVDERLHKKQDLLVEVN